MLTCPATAKPRLATGLLPYYMSISSLNNEIVEGFADPHFKDNAECGHSLCMQNASQQATNVHPFCHYHH